MYSTADLSIDVLMKTIFLALVFCSCSVADTITLTMTEVAEQPIDGLTVSKGGLQFTFTNPARTLDYDSGGPGEITFVQDPSIQGGSSQFAITFSAPVLSIQFGMAEIIGSVRGPLATIDLFNGGAVPFATQSFSASLVDPAAEGMFSFSSGPVTSIRITPASASPVLAFDNLTVVTAIPEPQTDALATVGLLLVAWKVVFRGRRKVMQM